jgi:hypothetical protein
MNRNNLVKFGAIVIILSLFLSIFVGAVASFATERANSASIAVSNAYQGPNPDIDGDGTINNEDPDIDGDGVDNGIDEDMDGDGVLNNQDGNPTSTNEVDSTPVRDARADQALQLVGGLAVLAVLGWLVALPYVRRRRGTATKR